MACCNFILKIGFLAFFALNAWNTLQNLESYTASFKTSYKNFETSVHARTGLAIPECLGHAHVHKHSDLIVKGVAWAQLVLAGLSLLVCGGLTSLVGLLYFTQQAIHLNVANLSGKTTFAELEKLTLAVALLMGSFAIGCASKGAACAKKVCPAKSQSKTGPSVTTTNQSKDKKKN